MEDLKSENLMIGNYVLNGKYPEIVTRITRDEIETMPSGGLYPVGYFNPIELTPELLEKCGFIVEDDFDNHSIDFYRLGNIHLQMSNYEGNECYYVWRDNIAKDGTKIGDLVYHKQYEIEIKYLHQLQNLTLLLTGNPLEIKW